jgi:hypothetical protein
VTEGFLTLAEVFPCFFLSCKANARVKLAKTGHRPHSMLFGCYLCCSMYRLCVNVYCHWVTTQLQLIYISISIKTHNRLNVQFLSIADYTLPETDVANLPSVGVMDTL